MAQSTYKKRAKKEATETFFLYVFFHSILSGIINMFNDD
jgi:hypothetical protein